MKFIILIPAYEPGYELLKLLKEIDGRFPTVVVNDGSDKRYDSIFTEAKKYAYVMSYDENMGKGYALKTGLNYIEDEYDNDYTVVTMDADGQHTLNDALKLCEYAFQNQDTLVIGKRLVTKDTPLRSKIGNSITRTVFNKTTKQKIYDTQSGLRAFSSKLNEYMLSINGNRFEYEMNVLLNLKTNNIKYKEIPIQTIYLNNNRDSHFRTFADSYKVYSIIYKWYRENKKR